jgi:cis-L-3-hydroxyproline dehydratase
VKIVAVEIYGYRLTYRYGQYVMSGGRVASAQESTVVRVVTDSDVDGWGETCPLAGTYLPAFSGGARAALELFAPSLIGLDPREIAGVHAAMNRVLRGSMEAKSAIDIACWDILGKACGLPVATLLGGRLQDDFPLYEAVPLGPPKMMASFVQERREQGITAFQVKVGNQPLSDAERVAHVLAVSGDSVVIADANGGWSLQDAVLAVRAMADMPIYLEQPCTTFDDCVTVRSLTTLPLVLDECILTGSDLVRATREAGAGSVNLKLGRLGGLTHARALRDLAVELRVSLSLEDTWGGDITTAAVAHLVASTPAESLLSASFFNDWTNEQIATVAPRSNHGRGSAPQTPGLGVEVDASKLGSPLFTT